LHWCAKRNRHSMIPILIKYGASIDAQDFSGRTPLHVACQYNHIECVKVLLNELANPLLFDNNGKMPIYYSKNKIITFFLQRAKNLYIVNTGFNINLMYQRIRTGLEYFMGLGDFMVLHKFIEFKYVKE
jgi:ankyrin repeat protein